MIQDRWERERVGDDERTSKGHRKDVEGEEGEGGKEDVREEVR